MQDGRRIVASSNRLSTGCSGESMSVGSPGGVDVFVAPHFIRPDNLKNAFVRVFWIVPRVSEGYNMRMAQEVGTVGKGTHKYEVNVPLMTNTRVLHKGDFLAVLQPERCQPRPAKKHRTN